MAGRRQNWQTNSRTPFVPATRTVRPFGAKATACGAPRRPGKR